MPAIFRRVVSKIKLCYDRHNSEFTEYLNKCLSREKYLNVVFLCDGNVEVLTHKVILASVSNLLAEIISSATHQEPLYISLPGVDHRDLQLLITFLHKGCIKLNLSELSVVQNIISFLGIKLKNTEVSNLDDAECNNVFTADIGKGLTGFEVNNIRQQLSEDLENIEIQSIGESDQTSDYEECEEDDSPVTADEYDRRNAEDTAAEIQFEISEPPLHAVQEREILHNGNCFAIGNREPAQSEPLLHQNAKCMEPVSLVHTVQSERVSPFVEVSNEVINEQKSAQANPLADKPSPLVISSVETLPNPQATHFGPQPPENSEPVMIFDLHPSVLTPTVLLGQINEDTSSQFLVGDEELFVTEVESSVPSSNIQDERSDESGSIHPDPLAEEPSPLVISSVETLPIDTQVSHFEPLPPEISEPVMIFDLHPSVSMPTVLVGQEVRGDIGNQFLVEDEESLMEAGSSLSSSCIEDEGSNLSGTAHFNQHNAVSIPHSTVGKNYLSIEQRKVLETTYKEIQYPDLVTLDRLTTQLNLPEKSVKAWFQKKRSKEKSAHFNQHNAVSIPHSTKGKNYLSAEQRKVLETTYEEIQYPDQVTLNRLATQLNLPEKSVKAWFQKKRFKEKSDKQKQSVAYIANQSGLDPWQLSVLELHYLKSKRPTRVEIHELSVKLKLASERVEQWFTSKSFKENESVTSREKSVLYKWQENILNLNHLKNPKPSEESIKKLSENLKINYNHLHDWFASRRQREHESNDKSVFEPSAENTVTKNTDYTEIINSFARWQKNILDVYYLKNKYPTVDIITDLSNKLNVDKDIVLELFRIRRLEEEENINKSVTNEHNSTEKSGPLTKWQENILEISFMKKTCPTGDVIINLSRKLNVKQNTVVEWFNLRRLKEENKNRSVLNPAIERMDVINTAEKNGPFSKWQENILNLSFIKNKWPTPDVITNLSQKFNVHDEAVIKWFTCRRLKEEENKNKSKVHIESRSAFKPTIGRMHIRNTAENNGPFSKWQENILNLSFIKNKCPTPEVITNLSRKLNVYEDNVIKWFTSRRLKEQELFKCTYRGCDKGFQKSSNLREHAMLHTEKRGAFVCNTMGCNSSFLLVSDLIAHKLDCNKNDEHAMEIEM